jgi:hypothetical protein
MMEQGFEDKPKTKNKNLKVNIFRNQLRGYEAKRSMRRRREKEEDRKEKRYLASGGEEKEGRNKKKKNHCLLPAGGLLCEMYIHFI